LKQARQELAKGHKIGIAAVIKPAPPAYEFLSKISEMRDRTAE
jgi:hypothetical protein